MNVSDVLLLLGGVALFLFGMSLMGDGLKKVAGNKLELILYRLSSTPLRGILLGLGVTAVIQSSSATSVMVVGFVNSAMMKLRQAIAVIMGAVIGTSVTGWVICLSGLGDSGVSAAFQLLSTESIASMTAIAGILLRMTAKKKSMIHIGDILIGFAVLMFGMKTMSGAVEAMRENPTFLSMITSFAHPVLGVLIGLVFTAILQSASAAVGILQALSVTGIITMDKALPMILGIAIGASAPVLLSGVGSSVNGKRAAFSYLVIEVIRVVLFAVLFYGGNAIFHFPFMNMTMNMFSIALLNTVFRLVTVLMLAPAVPLIEKLMTVLIRSNPEEDAETSDMERLEERFLAYPTLAVEQTSISIQKMAQLTKKSLMQAIQLNREYSEKGMESVRKLEELVDRYEDKIGSYLMKLTGREMTETQNRAVSQYLRAITDLERISDHALNIAGCAQEIHEKNISFSEKGRREMDNLMDAITKIVDITFDSFENNDAEEACRVEPLEQVIDQICKRMREKHAQRLQKGKCTIANGYVFNDLIADFERVSDHCSNLAIVLVELEDNAMEVHAMSEHLQREHTHHFEEYYEEYASYYLKKADKLPEAAGA